MAAPTGYFMNVSGVPTNPKFAEVAFLGTTLESNGTTKAMNVITHWSSPLGSLQGQEGPMGAAIQAAMQAQWLALFTADYTFNNIGVKFMDNPLNPQVLTPVAAAGTAAGDRGASFNAGVIRKITGVPSRNFRGSMHHGAVPEGFTTKDNLTGGGVVTYNVVVALWNGFVAAGLNDGVGQWFPIVYSKTLSTPLANPAIISGAWCQSFSLNLRLGTMKRRKEKN